MPDSQEIYGGFAREEAGARQARGRKGAPLAVHEAWQQAIRAGEPERFADVVDPFTDLRFSIEEVVEGETAVALRIRAEGTHAKEYLGVSATGRRISWDAVAIVHTRGSRVVGMWSQADLYGILQQIR